MQKKWSDFLVAVALRFGFGFILFFGVLSVLFVAAAINARLSSGPSFHGRVASTFYHRFVESGNYGTVALYISLMAIFGGILIVFMLPWKDVPWKQDGDTTKEDVKDDDSAA
jgi:hypothetical protein